MRSDAPALRDPVCIPMVRMRMQAHADATCKMMSGQAMAWSQKMKEIAETENKMKSKIEKIEEECRKDIEKIEGM